MAAKRLDEISETCQPGEIAERAGAQSGRSRNIRQSACLKTHERGESQEKRFSLDRETRPAD
jgi:hypothetical protein